MRGRSPFPLPEEPGALLREGMQRTLAFLAPRAGALVADAFATIGSLFVMLFALFFMLRDYRAFGQRIRNLLPLPERERERLISETRDLIIASVGAGLLVAAVQGTIGGLTYWALGIKAPVVWGVAMAICALIPLVGSTLVWVPTALWLLLSGEVGRGVILVLVGVLAIGMVDNVLRPLLLSGRTSASGLVIFLGLLGGVGAFGFIGLVLGPIILVTGGNLLAVFTRVEPPLIAGAEPPEDLNPVVRRSVQKRSSCGSFVEARRLHSDRRLPCLVGRQEQHQRRDARACRARACTSSASYEPVASNACPISTGPRAPANA